MEVSELPDKTQEALLNFVRALARRQARLDAAEERQKRQRVSPPPVIEPDEKPMAADAENRLKLSEALTPHAAVAILQSKGIAVSERTLREKARKLGACRIIGKAMFLMPEDIDAIIEGAKPKAKISVNGAPSVSQWSEADTDRLRERLAAKKPRGRPKSTKPSSVQS
ncbi:MULTISPECIES: hypothetical protein [unclassified Rhizobium]|uniref:hypothetical protein n=1 Tax=unclassified Rhizobium TaxID=2613769 RepID=UPI00161FC63B|nr:MULTISPECIES: hypothetical protein [unclassified Rhizobium]MBB3385570.1 hypothetical protein [Rhizobium sp. BK098]MBB3617275.1 hypothetical protein [Rhizobium sp. BK609]MBB3682889.1 hypothetical protein [Rhizobium sp. BK612]